MPEVIINQKKPLLLLILTLGINLLYPIVISILFLLQRNAIDFHANIIVHMFIAIVPITMLYFTPPIRFPTFSQKIVRGRKLFFILPFIVLGIWSAPWHIDRASVLASLAAICRVLWVIYVWSRCNEADNQELVRLAVITLALSAIDGSRTFGILAILGIIHCYRARIGVIFSFVIATPIIFSLIHALRIFLIDPDWQPNIVEIISEGFIGESYWGYYGLKQIQVSGNIFYIQDYIGTILYPIFGFLQYLFVESTAFIDPNYFARINVAAILGERYYPMGGYVIHSQFITLGPILGNLSLFVYLYLIRQVSMLFFGKHRVFCHWAFVFLAIKASPEVLMNFMYYLFIFQLIFTNTILRKIVIR